MKPTLSYGNAHTFSVTQQTKRTQKQVSLVKKWFQQFRNFVKEAIEKNGDFFLNDNDF
jgi:hypothetical protein